MHLKIKEEHKVYTIADNCHKVSKQYRKGHLFAICKSQVKLNRSRKTGNFKETGNYDG
jgi:hypothetical protein